MDPCDLFAQDLITHTASRSGAVAGGMGVTLRREKAEALFRIALARLSSRASLASSLLLVASCVVVPTLRPASIRAFLTQVRTTSPMAPSSSSSAILRIAPLTHTGPASASSAIPVARSRSSSGLLHAASYSRDPPAPSTPPNPGRSSPPQLDMQYRDPSRDEHILCNLNDHLHPKLHMWRRRLILFKTCQVMALVLGQLLSY